MVIGSFALGAAAVQVVHAAGTPPAYVIGEINVKDQDGYKNLSTCGTEGYWAAGGKYVAGGFNKSFWGWLSFHALAGKRSSVYAPARTGYGLPC
jgi:hypothetical protein